MTSIKTLLTVASRLVPPSDPLLLLPSCDMLVKSSMDRSSCSRTSDGGVEKASNGSGVGIPVGAFDDGLGVGWADGTTDGFIEGILVGSLVDGESEGLSEGRPEAKGAVGELVGTTFGSIIVGDLLGPLLWVGDVVESSFSFEVPIRNNVGDKVGFT